MDNFKKLIRLIILYACSVYLCTLLSCEGDTPTPDKFVTLDSLNNALLTSADAYATINYKDTLEEAGFCWNTTGNPSIDDSLVKFTRIVLEKWDFDIKPLKPNQTYFVKAFVKIKGKYAFSSEKSIKTWDGTLIDIMGYKYKTTQIGRQGWMAENLRTTMYADGTPVYVSTTPSNRTYWYGSGHQYIPNFDTDINNDKLVNEQDSLIYAQRFGLLYSWFAANNVYDHRENQSLYGKKVSASSRDICPKGWHVPTKREVEKLKNFIALKHGYDSITVYLTSKTGWLDNRNGNDLYGLGLIPSAYWHEPNATHSNILGKTVFLWNSTEDDDVNAGYWYADNLTKQLLINGSGKGISGFCVRCLKDK